MKQPPPTLEQLKEMLPYLCYEALNWYKASMQTGYQSNMEPANACNAFAVELYLRALQIVGNEIPSKSYRHKCYDHFMNIPTPIREAAIQRYAILQGPRG